MNPALIIIGGFILCFAFSIFLNLKYFEKIKQQDVEISDLREINKRLSDLVEDEDTRG